MTVILPPPAQACDILFGSGTYIRFMQSLAKSKIDIKTLQRIQLFQARETKASAYVKELIAAAPKGLDILETIDAQQQTEPRTPEFQSYIDHGLSWLLYGTGFNAAIAKNERKNIKTAFSVFLKPLDASSVSAAIAAQAADYAGAGAVMQNSLIGEYAAEEYWELYKTCIDKQTFDAISAPLRLIGLLALIVVFEYDLSPDADTSWLTNFLPDADTGPASHPFSRFLTHMNQEHGIATKSAATRVLMDEWHFQSELRKYNTWHSGTRPKKGSFFPVLDSLYRRRNIGPLDVERKRLIYYSLRALDKLARYPLDRYFGSKKDFFEIYPDIWRRIEEGTRD